MSKAKLEEEYLEWLAKDTNDMQVMLAFKEWHDKQNKDDLLELKEKHVKIKDPSRTLDY